MEHDALAELVGKLQREVGILKSEMIQALQGVSNFRKFQERGNKFFDAAEAVWAADGKRRARNLIIWGILIAAITPGIWIGIHWAVTTVDTILHIEEEWKQAHPSEFIHPQTFFDDSDPHLAQNREYAGETVNPDYVHDGR